MNVAFKDAAGAAGDAPFAIKVKLDAVTLPGPLEDTRPRLMGLTGESTRQDQHIDLDVIGADALNEVLRRKNAHSDVDEGLVVGSVAGTTTGYRQEHPGEAGERDLLVIGVH